jgi:hypothetical protein
VKKYLISQIIAIIISGSTFCNTILIDPSGAGSFKLGSTFESNGWKVLNFQNLNGWAIGSQFGATKAAFASPNWQALNPTPGINSNNLNKAFHFYYEIEIPNDEDILELSFKFKMGLGFFSVGVAPVGYPLNETNFQVQTGVGHNIFTANYFIPSQSQDWVTITRSVHTPLAGKKVWLIFSGFYFSNNYPPGSIGPLVSEISFSSRSSITYQSLPGSFMWNNPNAWIPQGIPGIGDNVIITSASTMTGNPVGHIKNLTIDGNLVSNINNVNGDLKVSPTGKFTSLSNSIFIKGHFTVENGGFIDARNSNFSFTRFPFDSAFHQVFTFHSPNQFEGGAMRALSLGNPGVLDIKSTSGRLAVCSLLSIAGSLNPNDALEINHAAIPNVAYTRISFFNSSTWSTPISRVNGSRIGLQYNGIFGSQQSPYVMGSRGEVFPGDTLYEFTVGNALFFLECPFDLRIGTNITSNFNLFGSLIMGEGKSVIFTDNAFGGCTPFGFPGPSTSNIYNNAHVEGGSGVSFRLHGSNLNRVWPVGISGQQFVLGMYGINANNALVRVSVLKADSGVAGQGVSFIHPLYRYRVELLEGTIEKVDSINLGYNSMLSGFSGSDFQNRRIVKSLSIGGSYEEIGGPAGRQVFPNSARPDFNFGWVRSNLGNYNAPSYYAFGLSNGSFSSIWINKPGSNMLWNDPSNWSGNVVPTAFDRVIIDAPGATIIVDQNSACLQLTLSNGTKLDIPPGIKFSVGG